MILKNDVDLTASIMMGAIESTCILNSKRKVYTHYDTETP